MFLLKIYNFHGAPYRSLPFSSMETVIYSITGKILQYQRLGRVQQCESGWHSRSERVLLKVWGSTVFSWWYYIVDLNIILWCIYTVSKPEGLFQWVWSVENGKFLQGNGINKIGGASWKMSNIKTFNSKVYNWISDS